MSCEMQSTPHLSNPLNKIMKQVWLFHLVGEQTKESKTQWVRLTDCPRPHNCQVTQSEFESKCWFQHWTCCNPGTPVLSWGEAECLLSLLSLWWSPQTRRWGAQGKRLALRKQWGWRHCIVNNWRKFMTLIKKDAACSAKSSIFLWGSINQK